MDGFIVSQRRDNPDLLEGKPVRSFDEVSEEMRENGLIVISHAYEKDCIIKELLLDAGFKNIISSDIQITSNITNQLRSYCCGILGKMEMINDFCINDTHIDKKFNICIYVVTSHNNIHNAFDTFKSKYIKHIQAGSALANCKICDITDDTGDNISSLNSYFSELTAGYWINKNDTINHYIGLYHYSRGLSITDEQIENIVNANIDVLLPVPYVSRHEMVTRVGRIASNIIYEAIAKISPEYKIATKCYFSNKIFLVGNIIFSKSEIYHEYYNWMFKVIDECIILEKKNNIEPPPRKYGYYGESLTNIYFIHHAHEYSMLFSEMKLLY